jgi:hypothetical protein
MGEKYCDSLDIVTDWHISNPCEYEKSLSPSARMYALLAPVSLRWISFIFSVDEFIFHRSVACEYNGVRSYRRLALDVQIRNVNFIQAGLNGREDFTVGRDSATN